MLTADEMKSLLSAEYGIENESQLALAMNRTKLKFAIFTEEVSVNDHGEILAQDHRRGKAS